MRSCPQYTYLSLGCSKAAEQRMLSFARAQVGKPFSNMGMARSLLFPRATDHRTYYCAELVAAILKQGGLMYAAHTHTHPSSSRGPWDSLLRLFFARARTRSFSNTSMVNLSSLPPFLQRLNWSFSSM